MLALLVSVSALVLVLLVNRFEAGEVPATSPGDVACCTTCLRLGCFWEACFKSVRPKPVLVAEDA